VAAARKPSVEPRARPEPLQLDQDPRFQRRQWIFERTGWALLAAGIAASACGLFGSGPLSDTSALEPSSGVRIDYPRFLRRHSPERLSVHVPLEAETQGAQQVRLWIDSRLLGAFELQQITPEPERVETGEDGSTFVFAAARAGEARIVLDVEYEAWGRLRGRIGRSPVAAVELRQLVYP
jgi:hypothetical protein